MTIEQINKSEQSKGNKMLQSIRERGRKSLYITLIGASLSGGMTSCEKKSSQSKNRNETELFLSANKVPDFLVGKKAGDLYAYYLGGKEEEIIEFEDSFSRDKNEAIHQLYEKKFQRENPNELKAAKEHYDNTVSKIDFNTVIPSNLNNYKNKIQKIISGVKTNLNWGKLGEKLFDGDKKKLKLLKALANNIDEKTIISYSMTELFPSKEGEYNKNFLNFLLRNAGTQYLENIPAIHDDYTSFGPFQFTSFAVCELEEQIGGASKINVYLPREEKIPGSVCNLKGEDHYKAAYLFILNNLISLINKDETVYQKALHLLTKKKNKADLAELVAIMHNKPGNGKEFLKERYKLRTDKKYLITKKGGDNYNYDANENGEIDLYESFIGGEGRLAQSHDYGEKTYYNFKALEKEN